MDIKEIINLRKSVRNFLPDPVPQELVDEILEAGRLAPSAQNRQPCVSGLQHNLRSATGQDCGLIVPFPISSQGSSW
jgi:hypothetical protein